MFTELPEAYIANVKLLVGYRRSDAIHPGAVARLRAQQLGSITVIAAKRDSQVGPSQA